MCFKKPKMPKVVEDPELARQKADALNAAQEQRAADKKTRTDLAVAQLSGSMLRRSLIAGGGGGQGFAAPLGRSLFVGG